MRGLTNDEGDDEEVVKAVWKSAYAVEDWPGKVTVRRFSPYNKFKIEGEGRDGRRGMEEEYRRSNTQDLG